MVGSVVSVLGVIIAIIGFTVTKKMEGVTLLGIIIILCSSCCFLCGKTVKIISK